MRLQSLIQMGLLLVLDQRHGVLGEIHSDQGGEELVDVADFVVVDLAAQVEVVVVGVVQATETRHLFKDDVD